MSAKQVKQEKPWSMYAKFHRKLSGYIFYDTKLRTKKSNYVMWAIHQGVCLGFLNNATIPQRFILLDKVGFKNGKRLTKREMEMR